MNNKIFKEYQEKIKQELDKECVIMEKSDYNFLTMLDNSFIQPKKDIHNGKNKDNHWVCDICNKVLYMKDKSLHYNTLKHKKNIKNNKSIVKQELQIFMNNYNLSKKDIIDLLIYWNKK